MRGCHPQRPSRHPGSQGHSPAHAPAQCVCSQDRPCGSENLGRPVGKARLRPRGGGIRAREATGAEKQPDADAAPPPEPAAQLGPLPARERLTGPAARLGPPPAQERLTGTVSVRQHCTQQVAPRG